MQLAPHASALLDAERRSRHEEHSSMQRMVVHQAEGLTMAEEKA